MNPLNFTNSRTAGTVPVVKLKFRRFVLSLNSGRMLQEVVFKSSTLLSSGATPLDADNIYCLTEKFALIQGLYRSKFKRDPGDVHARLRRIATLH